MLVLWDVDHTLVETRGVGRAIFERAFLAATGTPFHERPPFTGRTDLNIMRESLQLNGVDPTDEAVRRLSQALVDGYQQARADLRSRGRAMPGAATSLATLAAEADVRQSLLTGNLREIARVKLEVFGLDGYVDFEAGGYGADHTDRAELVHRAQARATRRFGHQFDNAHTVLIGDTPNDVRAARAAGVHMIGIATGGSDVEQLRAAGADAVLATLEAETMRKLMQLCWR
ncbi:MAG TPA: haloacid dehalogenase-like hydrolase [Pseudonocardiaceae bacterium]|jgi:phosphoglycolate phosphatase-like HAD superfamily hydrolase|nr:haloacid dehalogenase-like hydrolase [Pseudonocardiaceae bacterium]